MDRNTKVGCGQCAACMGREAGNRIADHQMRHPLSALFGFEVVIPPLSPVEMWVYLESVAGRLAEIVASN